MAQVWPKGFTLYINNLQKNAWDTLFLCFFSFDYQQTHVHVRGAFLEDHEFFASDIYHDEAEGYIYVTRRAFYEDFKRYQEEAYHQQARRKNIAKNSVAKALKRDGFIVNSNDFDAVVSMHLKSYKGTIEREARVWRITTT